LYHFERNHQGKENMLLFPAPGSPPSHPNPDVTCHARLGGLLNFYQHAAQIVSLYGHRCVSFGKLGDFAATLKKGAHVQVEGELHGREYEKDGVKHRVFECHLESILKLNRAERRGEDESGGSES
jgi:hypothetical protein